MKTSSGQDDLYKSIKLTIILILAVSTVELIGKSGEKTSFDLRYFEIKPEGYSSLEKHVYEHVIIGVRGNGILIKGDSSFNISSHDIAYVSPHEKHQLRNNGKEPFGFLCIVDHRRDKPVTMKQ